MSYCRSVGTLPAKRTSIFAGVLSLFLMLAGISASPSTRVLPDIFGFLKKPNNQYARISTSKGECVVRLYNETPKHRDNFVRLVKKDFYNGTLFHRVISSFMIQGGDPNSRNAKPGQMLGEGDLGYRIPAEFNPLLFHKKGALAAARDDNPAKSSSACQFYIVQGRTYSDDELNNVEQKRLEGRKIPASQRKVYQVIGGAPFLDQKYTVFGEVVRGIDLVDSVAAVPTDGNDRPLTDIAMRITLLKKGGKKA
ncbi:peptidylprolyl isomerase [Arcticibacter sp. MXS-1]|uniref:peptidylprolyl isomerase n=1 Tax=Arcticibacter sp. MXS-1 TaxID=3341726 RepID=UPI0035A8A65A